MEAAGFVVGNALYYVLEQAGWSALEGEESRDLLLENLGDAAI